MHPPPRLALLLAMVGLFGVLAYSVQQRVRDFGLRRALGATTSDVLRVVFGKVVRMVAAGIAAGLILSRMFGRLLGGMLFGVQPWDPLTFACVAVALALTAMLAIAGPRLACDTYRSGGGVAGARGKDFARQPRSLG